MLRFRRQYFAGPSGGCALDCRSQVGKRVDHRRAGAGVDNPGCILHLRGAADAARASFEVRHFVEPLAERLRQLVQLRKEE